MNYVIDLKYFVAHCYFELLVVDILKIFDSLFVVHWILNYIFASFMVHWLGAIVVLLSVNRYLHDNRS